MQYDFADKDRIRVIVNTDAKNEADDQYAIVHALLHTLLRYSRPHLRSFRHPPH